MSNTRRKKATKSFEARVLEVVDNYRENAMGDREFLETELQEKLGEIRRAISVVSDQVKILSKKNVSSSERGDALTDARLYAQDLGYEVESFVETCDELLRETDNEKDLRNKLIRIVQEDEDGEI